MSYQEAGARQGKKGVVPDDDLIKPTTLRDIRQAHDPIDDLEFEQWDCTTAG